MHFINNAEMAAFLGEGFAKQEIITDTKDGYHCTTVFTGTPRITSPEASTDRDPGWKIRRTVIVDDGTTTSITITWAEGSWTDRASLTYKYL